MDRGHQLVEKPMVLQRGLEGDIPFLHQDVDDGLVRDRQADARAQVRDGVQALYDSRQPALLGQLLDADSGILRSSSKKRLNWSNVTTWPCCLRRPDLPQRVGLQG